MLTKRRGMLDTQTRGVEVDHTDEEIGVGHTEGEIGVSHTERGDWC